MQATYRLIPTPQLNLFPILPKKEEYLYLVNIWGPNFFLWNRQEKSYYLNPAEWFLRCNKILHALFQSMQTILSSHPLGLFFCWNTLGKKITKHYNIYFRIPIVKKSFFQRNLIERFGFVISISEQKSMSRFLTAGNSARDIMRACLQDTVCG